MNEVVEAGGVMEREAMLRELSGVGGFELSALDPGDIFALGTPAAFCERLADTLGDEGEPPAPVIDTWLHAVHPDDLERVKQARLARGVDDDPLELEYRVVTRRGDVRWWHERSRVLPSRRPGKLRVLAAVRDVTAERRREARIQRETDLLRQTQGAARVGGWEIDMITGELHWTDETRRIHEVPADFVPDVNTAINFYAPEHVSLISAAVQRCQRGEPFDVELDLITYTGARLTVHATGRPYFEDGAVTRIYGAFHDISEAKRREQALQTQLDLIARQETAIRALSTPIIQIWDNIITLPVIGNVNAERATQIMDRLLTEVVRTRARFAILDLTGVDEIETTTADQLFRIVRAVGLLGAKALLCGLTPPVAQTLTELGVEVAPAITHRNLQEALQRCIRELARRGAPGELRSPS